MKYYFNVAVANGINKLGWTPDVPDEHLGMKFGPTCHEVITICEEIEKLVETWPVVTKQNGSSNYAWWEKGSKEDTHTARLAFIEEIKKECVKHEPAHTVRTESFSHRDLPLFIQKTICKHCGCELFATWSEKK